MPTVSIIIPTYLHRDCVLQTLDSVFEQTFTDYEVIVVNDGSPDDTAEVVRPHVESGRICYIEQPNAGQASARNRGLLEARGEFVAFLDDDDLWLPDKLEWQVQDLQNSDMVAIGGSMVRLGEEPETDGAPYVIERVTPSDVFVGCPFASPGQTLIRTEALRAVGGFDPTLWGTDDFDLWIRLSLKGSIGRSNRLSLRYRIHSGNASRATGRMLANGVRTVEKNLAAFAPQRRRRLRRAGYRFIYSYFCSRLLAEVKDLCKRGRFLFAVGLLVQLKPFVRQFFRDPELFVFAFRDLIPTRSKAMVKRHRNYWNHLRVVSERVWAH